MTWYCKGGVVLCGDHFWCTRSPARFPTISLGHTAPTLDFDFFFSSIIFSGISCSNNYKLLLKQDNIKQTTHYILFKYPLEMNG